MSLNSVFTYRASPDDRRDLEELSRRLMRSQSDVIRVLVRESLTALKQAEAEQKSVQRDRAAQSAEREAVPA